MSTAHIENAYSVDVKVNVVVSGEVEVKVGVLIVYELRVTFKRKIVVGAIVITCLSIVACHFVGVAGIAVAHTCDRVEGG